MNEQCTDVQAFVGKDLGFLFPFAPQKTNMTLDNFHFQQEIHLQMVDILSC